MNNLFFGRAARFGFHRAVAAMLAAVSLVSTVPVSAQEKKIRTAGKVPAEVDLVIANGTGELISDIEIRPSSRLYPKDKNVAALSGLELKDQEWLGIPLPPQMKDLEAYEVVLKYGTQTAKTRQPVSVSRNGEIPQLIASIDGKDSTVPLVVGSLAGGGAIATEIGIAAYCVTMWGAGGLTWLLALPGSMLGGLFIAIAVPVLLTVGVFTAAQLLSADTLVLTQIN